MKNFLNSVLRLHLCLFFFLGVSTLHAQELNVKVTVDANLVQGVDKRVFQDMEKTFQDFLNQTNWTEDKFKNEERIQANINLTITKGQVGSFEGTATIQSVRPVYGTDFNTLMFSYVDQKFNFEYVEGQPMNFQRNGFFNNITSLLAFYAYIIIGIDYDSFSEYGGESLFQSALIVLNNAEQQDVAWQATGSTNNRYWLLADFLNQQLRPFRQGLYLYHRKGLDMLLTNKEEAFKSGLQTVKNIKKANDLKPVSVAVNNFFDCKNKEIVKYLKNAEYPLRREAHDILIRVDPTRANIYAELMKN